MKYVRYKRNAIVLSAITAVLYLIIGFVAIDIGIANFTYLELFLPALLGFFLVLSGFYIFPYFSKNNSDNK
jgi:hypothetical protein